MRARPAALKCLLFWFVLTACWSVSLSTASDPFPHVGWPGCRGGERGWYGHIQRAEPETREIRIYTAVLARPFMDPSAVICYLEPDGEIEALERPRQGIIPMLRK